MSQTLKVEIREKTGSRESRRLRKSGFLPATICTKNEDSISVMINTDELSKSISAFGRSAVFKLALGKKKLNTMIKDIEIIPLTNELLNVIFQQVSLKEELKVTVALRVINTENIEHEKLRLSTHIDSLSVIGLPNDIPNSIEIDATDFKVGDNIYIKDLMLPDKITTDADPEAMVLSVSAPKMVEVDEPEAEEGEDAIVAEDTEEKAEDAE